MLFRFSVLLVVVAHCLLVSADDEKMKVIRLGMKCRDEQSLKQEELSPLKDPERPEVTDQRLKCFLRCLLNGLNLMNDSGELTVEDVSDSVSKYKELYYACKDVTGSDPCDKAYNFHKCVWDIKSPKEEPAV